MDMKSRAFHAVSVAALLLLVTALFAACGGGNEEEAPGLTRAEVEEVVGTAVAAIPKPEPGLTRGDVEEIVGAAVAAIPKPEAGLTAAEAERIARAAVASIPPKSAPADYTRFFVDKAMSRYETQGLDATLTHYNRAESIDGQWYVFIIDENDLVIGHPDPGRLGLDMKGWVGTDANGYNFGPEMLSATEEGKWVSYVYRNPESGRLGANSGQLELKNVWVVRRDGLLFGSGWYINSDEFTRYLVTAAADKIRDEGLIATIAYFASPEDTELAGLEETIAYYNGTETVDGRWFAFIAEPSGRIVGHSDPSLIGSDTQDVFGTDFSPVNGEGGWVTNESLRAWVVASGEYILGSGWQQDESGG